MCIAKRVSRIRDPSLPEHSWSGWLGCRWERECGRYARLFTAEQHRRSRNLYRRSMTSDPGKTRQSTPSRPLSRRKKEGDENFLRPRANVLRLFLPSSSLSFVSSTLSFFSTRTFYFHVCLFLLQDFQQILFSSLSLFKYIYIFILLFSFDISLPRNSSQARIDLFGFTKISETRSSSL